MSPDVAWTTGASITGAHPPIRLTVDDMTEPEHEPFARTAGEQDHEDVDTWRGADAGAPQDPETDPQSS